MAPRTRSTTNSPVKKVPTISVLPTNPKQDSVKVLITPQLVSENARFLSLRQTRDSGAKKFLFCPSGGLFELKRTTAPSGDPRSLIFAPIDSEDNGTAEQTASTLGSFEQGYVNKDAELFIATPYDMAFILLQSVAPLSATTKKALFQPIEDLLSSPDSYDQALQFVFENAPHLIKNAMLRICDTVEAGDEVMFRYSEEKTLKYILEKAQRLAESGLPASIEERFVTRILEVPMMSVKREEYTASIVASLAVGDTHPQDDNLDSQSTGTSTTVSAVFSETSTTTASSSFVEDAVTVDVKRLLRVRTAYNFIVASCLPSFVAARLSSKLCEMSSLIDFRPLEDHLKELAVLRAEAVASRSMSDFSRKRGLDEEEMVSEKAEKKRKQEEEEKRRKANESRGVRDLKKVNVTGMKKMSDFFNKKPITTKVKT